ncbi:MAG: DUF3298 domain-containing protein [Oscillospiraceae bacterium]|nr:DUF3298 domain-containing protein [Oscillospiraceae bacterium]
MKLWIRMITPALACAAVLCACTGSPAPAGEPSSSPPVTEAATETPTLIPVPPQETEPPQKTPPPSAEPAPVWPANTGIGISVTAWSDFISENGELLLAADITLPVFSGAPDAIARYYAAALEDFQRSAQARADEAKEMFRDGALTRPYALSQGFSIECHAARLISVIRTEERDMGGMHSEMEVYGETFSADSGKLLALDDFFTVPPEEYLPLLLAGVAADLDGSAADLFDDWRETAEALLPRAAFCVSPEGLSLFYPELTLAPYALGVVRADIPWDMVSDAAAPTPSGG